MKKFIIFIISLMFCVNAFSQNYIKDGKTFTEIENVKALTTIKTDYLWKDKSGKVYPIYLTKNNTCYIIRISKKSGKEYKQYLPKEIASRISTEITQRDLNDTLKYKMR